MTNEWRVMVARTTDGLILEDVRPSSFPTFTRAINDPGSWGVTAHFNDPSNLHVDFRRYATSDQYSWVVCYGDYVVQAGPVTSYSIDDEARTLKVGGPGIGGLFKSRVMRNPNGHTAIVDPSEDIVATDTTIRRMVRDMVALNLAQPNYGLPIDIDTVNEAGDSTATYHAYELKSVLDLMDQYADNYEQCEYEFAPYLTNNGANLRWELRVSSPTLGDQATTALWDSNGAMSHIAVDGDASTSTVTRTWVKGSGTDRALLTGFAEDTSLYTLGYPGKDYVDGEHTSVTEQSTLESYADAALESFRWPVETWSADVRIDGKARVGVGVEVSPALGHWNIGDAPQFSIHGHSWIPDGTYRRRILGYSNSAQDRVKLTLQEGEPVL